MQQQRVKMVRSRTITDEGSSTTYLADHFYLLSEDLALELVTDGDAELDPPGADDEES